MKPLQAIAENTIEEIKKIAGPALSDEQKQQISHLIDDAVVKALLEGQHRAVDAALNCPDADQDLTHKIAKEIRLKNDALIVNLTSLR
ncbi:hypothetical protein MNBD_ALPHA08-2026 [hydrothermal vent metagenome]|uniref:Uncharacterized protein n=1 Tax=hydrothermal vent metagenome TaxID=652676 RepID=A0A3B0SBE1_9ZZZZ